MSLQLAPKVHIPQLIRLITLETVTEIQRLCRRRKISSIFDVKRKYVDFSHLKYVRIDSEWGYSIPFRVKCGEILQCSESKLRKYRAKSTIFRPESCKTVKRRPKFVANAAVHQTFTGFWRKGLRKY